VILISEKGELFAIETALGLILSMHLDGNGRAAQGLPYRPDRFSMSQTAKCKMHIFRIIGRLNHSTRIAEARLGEVQENWAERAERACRRKKNIGQPNRKGE